MTLGRRVGGSQSWWLITTVGVLGAAYITGAYSYAAARLGLPGKTEPRQGPSPATDSDRGPTSPSGGTPGQGTAQGGFPPPDGGSAPNPPLGNGGTGPGQPPHTADPVKPISRYEGRIILASDGKQYWIKDGRRRYIASDVLSKCIRVRASAGDPIPVPDADINAIVQGVEAYCPYETERGLNFVREDGDTTVWLVGIDRNGRAYRRHVGKPCVDDADTTSLKNYHIWPIPKGEADGRYQGQDFFGDAGGPVCDALPKP